MKTIYANTLCIICCLNKMTTNEKFCYINEDKKQKFESFISKFDVYGRTCIDKEFFQQRDERNGELHTELSKQEFSSFIPYDPKDCSAARASEIVNTLLFHFFRRMSDSANCPNPQKSTGKARTHEYTLIFGNPVQHRKRNGEIT